MVLNGKHLCAAALIAALGACANTNAPETGETIVTVPYEASSFDQTANQRIATEECMAEGFLYAEPSAQQPNMAASVVRYKAYRCTNFPAPRR